MRNFEWDWFIGWTCATVIILGLAAALYFGSQNHNEKYYASMDKCIAAGGSFIPQHGGNAVCFMGNKQ